MKTLAKNWLVVLLVVVVLAIGAAIYAKMRRDRISEQIRKINQILDGEIGIDGRDGKSIIYGTKPLAGYEETAKTLAKQVYSAKSWYNDDEDAVYAAFAEKTKGQIASIYQAFTNLYGQDLDAFMKSFLNEAELGNVYRIINQAA